MREILFRGKRKDNGEWVEGFYVSTRDIVSKEILHIIVRNLADSCGCEIRDFEVVDPASISQFTGCHDKNGKRIFEGDIVKAYSSYFNGECYREHEVIKPVAYDCGGFFLGSRDDDSEGWLGDWCISCDDTQDFIEVIGNIHDSPELLEVGE